MYIVLCGTESGIYWPYLPEIQAPLGEFYYVNHRDLACGINMLKFHKLSNITMNGS